MEQTPDTSNPREPFGFARATITAPAAVRIIGRNLGSIAEQVRSIEPDEMSRPELLSLLAVIASGLDLSGALLEANADRLNIEAAARAGVEL